jgi:hypothetical protein
MFATARLSLAVAGVALVATVGGAGATAGRVDAPSLFELTFEGASGNALTLQSGSTRDRSLHRSPSAPREPVGTSQR